ncbi:DUF2897 family protein [Thalassotalea sp. HSM 43]|uniref:DUF2897 family protein n=1 Tax=Thalassotalea sp. HSM 43 TaxID=2552945 RepID=UPI001081A2E6|nr:DUF2897 family protein [Thalassotalea sp. HSM 43]QBY05330.1 DUF2897 family protein [Thalassotalea sp. HSM 43]
MSTFWIITLIIAFIISGIYVVYKSAKKFNLSDEQLKRIKERNKQLDAQDNSNK